MTPRTLIFHDLSGWPFPVRSLGPTNAGPVLDPQDRQPVGAPAVTSPCAADTSSPEALRPPVPHVLAVLRGDGEAHIVSEVGPDREVKTGWGKTRPR